MLETHQPKANFSMDFVCPICKAALSQEMEQYQCEICQRTFPIILGIPDFRIRSDRYLSLDEERAKAMQIATKANANFSCMLDYYYDITGDVPAALASRYKAYHFNGPKQARHCVESMQIDANDIVLDVGCGTGGALIAAAEQSTHLYGMDIALRWLVICQQRLNEQGLSATLVCADIEHPPFRDESFSKIIATDLLENVYSVDKSLAKLSELLTINGKLWIAGSNKYCLGPHPSTRLWAIGYFPKKLRSKVVSFFRGVDSLRFINLISPRCILNDAKRFALHKLFLRPKMVTIDAVDKYPFIDLILIKIYIFISRLPLFHRLMILVGPAFEILLEKSTALAKQKEIKQK